MQVKEKILFSGKDVKLKLPLSSTANLVGLQESIDEYIERQTGLSINPATDAETFRFRNIQNSKVYSFKFYNGSTYASTLLNAGFTIQDITGNSETVNGSFFIIQVFDSIKSDNQTLIHSNFLNGFDFPTASSVYAVFNIHEFSNMYIPQNFLDSISGDTFLAYAKFYFYNAKFGKLQPFINEANEPLTTENKLYHELVITKSTRQYDWINPSTLLCKELVNPTYATKINDTLDSFNEEKPTYPSGTTFNNNATYSGAE